MADYYFNPETKQLLNDHPIDISFHKEYFNMIHICTCAKEHDPNAPVEYDRMIPHPDYKLFSEFVPINREDLPPELKALLMLHSIG